MSLCSCKLNVDLAILFSLNDVLVMGVHWLYTARYTSLIHRTRLGTQLYRAQLGAAVHQVSNKIEK